MTKKLDSDIRCLREATRALDRSSSRRMLRANIEFLYDRFIRHPSPDLPKHLKREEA